ncbi:MAG: deoxyguanosinetriphosphate triphosphohydrolase [Candidatus Binatia bacterium]
MRDRAYFEGIERKHLAPYAMFSADSRGREHEEPEHGFRMVFQRDRDRIIHSTAFRRLEYKTQVFVNHEGDYYRTRLTHTMETAQVTRTIARALGLNQDLAEAVALAHDLGHTPFGHAGEAVLAELMKDHGGFEHNSQSLRIVEVLEQRYPGFAGLNLSYEVREGILKHSTWYDRPQVGKFNPGEAPPLEAQIVDFADEIAYNSHDIDDGIQSGMIDAADLAGVGLWDDHYGAVCSEFPGAGFSVRRYQAVKRILDAMVSDLLGYTTARLSELGVTDLAGVRRTTPRIVGLSAAMDRRMAELKSRLMERLYQHQRVRRMGAKARRVMGGLFRAYMEDPYQMPPEIVARASAELPMARVIADYIACMTDRFALEEYAKLYDPFEKV